MKKLLILLMASVIAIESCTKEPSVVNVTGITLDKTALTLTEGESETVTATVLPSNADNRKVLWSSSDGSVATVSGGKITAVKAGSATIEATSEDGGKTAACTVSVKAKTIPVTGVSLNKTSLTLNINDSETLVATITPENATDKAVTWKVTGTCVTVADGKVTAVASGKSVVSVITHDGNLTATCNVTVNEPSCLKFTTTSGTNTLSFVKNGNNNPYLEYSYDKSEWKQWFYFNPLEFSDSKPVYIRGKNESGLSSSTTKYTNFKFATDAPVKCTGSIMSLISYTSELSTVPGSCCFYALFYGCTCLQTAPELPATTLSTDCYNSLFIGCSGLTSAPALPATALAENCYADMFRLCTGLTAAPELPAKELAKRCYGGMFSCCYGLTAAPALPATELSSQCYYNMFTNCTGLTDAPELPATTLASACYQCMFQDCTGLKKAPVLSAATLVSSCYDSMFSGCSNLNYVKMMATSISAYNCLHAWLLNVADTGTFVKSASATWKKADANIPDHWTVVEE